jgi:multiple sugar transport system permease protein
MKRESGIPFLAPACVLLLVVAFAPIGWAMWLSLRRIVVVFQEDRFVGLANYAFLVKDPRFLAAAGHTAYFAAVSVLLEVALGLPIALVLHAKSLVRAPLRAAVLVPWAVPTVVSARLWAWMWNPDHGVLSAAFGLEGTGVLARPALAMHAAILVDVWKSTPFVALLLLAGLSGIPEELHAAARMDGASALRRFTAVTLPLLKPTLAITVLFRGLDALRVFDAVYVLTGGGPADTTETLSVYAYKTMMRSGDLGYGSALSVATFTGVLVVSGIYLLTAGRAATALEGRS